MLIVCLGLIQKQSYQKTNERKKVGSFGAINLRPNLFLLVSPYIAMSAVPYASSFSMQSWKLGPLGASKAPQISGGG